MVSDGRYLSKDGLYLVEPSEKLLNSGDSLVGRSLVTAGNSVPVRIMNLSHEDKVFNPGANIATMSPVTEVQGVGSKPRGINDIPAHLVDLYERSTQGMSAGNCKQIFELAEEA